jgi:hypothetical protein
MLNEGRNLKGTLNGESLYLNIFNWKYWDDSATEIVFIIKLCFIALG